MTQHNNISPIFIQDTLDNNNDPFGTESLAPSRIGRSELSSSLSPTAPLPLFNLGNQKEVNRTGNIPTDLKKTTGDSRFAKSKFSALAPLSAGVSAGSATDFQTTSVGEASVGVGLSALGGATAGALAGAQIGALGGPIGILGGAAIGGLSALVVSGAKAWFGVRNSRKRSRQLKELQRKAEKQRQAEIARDEKWRKLNRFDNLKIAGENRKQVQLQNKWTAYEKFQTQMLGLVNNDAKLNQETRNLMTGRS